MGPLQRQLPQCSCPCPPRLAAPGTWCCQHRTSEAPVQPPGEEAQSPRPWLHRNRPAAHPAGSPWVLRVPAPSPGPGPPLWGEKGDLRLISLAKAKLPSCSTTPPRASQPCRHQCGVSSPGDHVGSFSWRIRSHTRAHAHAHSRTHVRAHTHTHKPTSERHEHTSTSEAPGLTGDFPSENAVEQNGDGAGLTRSWGSGE